MKFKRLTAFAVVATMIVGNCVTALAADNDTGVDGTGAVEFDDSVDIVYDSITVPSLNANTYKFEIDPDGLLADYGGEDYESGDNVFFTAIKDRAKIVVKDKATKIYKKTYTEKAKDTGKDFWTGIVTGATGTTTITYTVADGFYLWVPKDAYTGTGASGKSGEYTAIDASNVAKYFDIVKDANDTDYDITFRKDYKAMVTSDGVVCNGKIYELGYTETSTKDTVGSDTYDTIVDSDADPIDNYITVTSGALTAVKDLYTDKTGGGYEALADGKVDYVAATAKHIATSDVVYVTNKSTKTKTVKATITLKNPNGLKVRNSSTFAATDKDASIYIAALSQASGAAQATATALAENGDAISGSFTVDIAGTTDKGFTYQTEERNNAGGHKYARYANPDATYNSHSFSVTAKANDNTDDDTKAAWKAYGASFTESGKTPTLNVVYSVTDYVEPVTQYTVTYHANYTGADPETATEDVDENGAPTATGISFTRDGFTFKGWGESASATEADKVTLSGLTITANKDLYAIWAKDVVTGTLAVQKIGQNTYATVKGASGANLEEGKLTSLKINDVDFTAKAIFYEGLYGVKGADLIAESISVSSGSTLTAVYTVDGTDYTATYTMP